MTVAPAQSMSWAMWLAIAGVVIEFSVSANVLTWIGVSYVSEGGFLPEKLHPGTYLLCFAFVIQVMRQARLNDKIWCLFGGDRKLVIYFGCLGACLIYMMMTTGTRNMVVLLDTFLPAGMLACVVHNASARELNVLLYVFRCGICANATLALAEAAAHVTLVPLYLNELEYHPIGGEFRPTALYDHPLTGGVMTLMGVANAPRSLVWRFGYLALAGAALIAFGGRVAVAAAMVSAVMLAGATLFTQVLHRDRRAFRFMLQCGLYLTICLIVAVVALEAGFGERLVSHLYWDPSAQVRLAQWALLKDLTGTQLIFGTRREDLLALLTPLWLQSGVEQIENFWLLMFVSLGAVGFSVFITGFLTLLAWCWQRTGLRGRVLLLSVVAVVSTSNSLGRKSTLLVGLVAATACCSERRPSRNRKILAPAAPAMLGVFVPANR
jgi:hypothetical protein